ASQTAGDPDAGDASEQATQAVGAAAPTSTPPPAGRPGDTATGHDAPGNGTASVAGGDGRPHRRHAGRHEAHGHQPSGLASIPADHLADGAGRRPD
ncbi:hypothetical protein ABQ292_10200, partial [Geodermatophilus sp. WL48A]